MLVIHILDVMMSCDEFMLQLFIYMFLKYIILLQD